MGAEFRPEFQLLAPLVRSLKATSSDGVKVVLLSATFSQSTLNTLKALFGGKRQASVIEVNGSFLRPEPVWYVSEASATRITLRRWKTLLLACRRQ